MKNVMSILKVLALVCLTVMTLSACATEQFQQAAATANAQLTAEAVRAAQGDIVIGNIKAIDTTVNTIRIKDETFTVKPADIAALKVGQKVKVTLATGTMNVEKIVQLRQDEMKQTAKQKYRETKDQAIQNAIDQAVQMQTQQAAPAGK